MPKVDTCDLCQEVNVFEPLIKFETLDICAECAKKIDEQHERRMRAVYSTARANMPEQIPAVIDDWALDSFRTYSDERLNNLRNLFRNDRILALLDHNEKAAQGLLIFQRLVEQVQAERRNPQAPSPDTPL